MITFSGMVYAIIFFMLMLLTLIDHHFWPRENGKRIPFKQFLDQIEIDIENEKKKSENSGESMSTFPFPFLFLMFITICFIFSR